MSDELFSSINSSVRFDSAPLQWLKVKDAPFVWAEERQSAFRQLKRALMKPPILVYLDIKRKFKLYVDSS
ncbi:hypothetical protein PC128_g20768 [Phytophthora cactorum]|nr:hypothetical protein PC128_g20768 [Phytophthora cactorum]